ncbi:MAG: hypothetical protein JXN64_01280 [Spirochaetes bacterium]|nr:hypothetical protein [Spirochaetota bacterium]
MKKYLIIAGIMIYGLACGIIGYKLAPAPGTVDVGPPVVTPTQYHESKTDDCEINKKRAESPISITGEYKDGVLGVDASDSWKSAHADFPISCIPSIKHHIIQVHYIIQYHKSSFFHSYGASYLYNFDKFAIGAGGIGSNQNIGIQAIAQVMF